MMTTKYNIERVAKAYYPTTEVNHPASGITTFTYDNLGNVLTKQTANLKKEGKTISERNEIEGTFGTTKRDYRADDIRAKLDQTADTWIGACFFAKNIMKFLRGLLCLIFEKSGLKTFQKRIMSFFDGMEAVLTTPQGCMKEIN